jgi:hypothetical protein
MVVNLVGNDRNGAGKQRPGLGFCWASLGLFNAPKIFEACWVIVLSLPSSSKDA